MAVGHEQTANAADSLPGTRGPKDAGSSRARADRHQPGTGNTEGPAQGGPLSEISWPTRSSIKVVLADDRRVARQSLRLGLELKRDLEVVAEAADPFMARHQASRHRPDVLLLDLRAANGSNIDLIRRLRAEVPGTEIVVVTTQDSPTFARDAIDAGAAGYVLDSHADSELPIAIRHAARGRRYVCPLMSARLDALRSARSADGLSQRETEVLRLLALGHTNAEIGNELHVSSRTVETHRAHIHRKLGLAKRWELVQYALARRLIGPDPNGARTRRDDDG